MGAREPYLSQGSLHFAGRRGFAARQQRFHIGDSGFVVGREGDQGELPEVDLLQDPDALFLVVLVVIKHVADGCAGQAAGLHVGMSTLGQRIVLDEQTPLEEQPHIVLAHLGVDADRLAHVVLPEHCWETALLFPSGQARLESSADNHVSVAVLDTEDRAITLELARFTDRLDGQRPVKALFCLHRR
ncbi:hypothetical protein D9M71_604140 [compost metagenome]